MHDLAADWLVTIEGGPDLGAVFLEHFAMLARAMRQRLASHPILGPRFAAASPEELEAADAATERRLALAFAGDWHSYEDGLRRDGGSYAGLGLTFADWYSLVSAWSEPMVPIVVERFREDGPRLAAVLDTMQKFRDRALVVIGESYMNASEEAVRRHDNAVRTAQEASRLKSEFLANMSHELRTPLNSILGFSELLFQGEVGPLSAQQQEFIGDIHTSGKHLLRLINDILDLSKVEAGKLEFHPADTSFDRLAREVTSVLRAVAQKNQVTLEIDVDPSVDAVHLDGMRLKQVLYNYLSNAIKFSPPRGHVSITARPESDTSFRLSVRDDGPGISAADVRRLFTEFEQLDPSRAKAHGGTGLGLALTRRLVEAQGGSVGVESTVGKGSTFFAVLPVRSPLQSTLPHPRRGAGRHPDGPRVLVIEDDGDDQNAVVSLLLSADFSVDTAATGAQALRALQERTYQAITLDLVLPDTSGFSVLQAIRKSPGHETVPVIVISMTAHQVTAALAVEDVLQKPLQTGELLRSLERVGVCGPTASYVLVVDDDVASARLMASSLSQLGVATAIAEDGLQALELAAQKTPSAVVLDLVMPNLDGFGFLREFRLRAEWQHIPVLVWTTRDLTQEEYANLMRSANGVVAKDGTGGRALLEAIRAHLPQLVGSRRP